MQNLAYNKQGQAMVVTDEPAWHGESIIIPGGFTPDEAYIAACPDMDFAYDYYHPINPFTGAHYGRKKVIFRTDTMEDLSDVGVRYEIMQPAEFNELIDNVIAEYREAHLLSWCVLGDGGKMAATAKLPAKMDGKERMVSFGTSVHGDRSIWAAKSQIKIVCSNTEAMVWNRGEGKVSIPHTSGWKNRIGDIILQMRQAVIEFDVIDAFEKEMRDYTICDKFTEDIVRTLLPEDEDGKVTQQLSEKRNDLYYMIKAGTGERDESLADVWNGATEFDSNPDRYQFGKAVQFSSGTDKLARNLYGGNDFAITKKAAEEISRIMDYPLPSVSDIRKWAKTGVVA